MRIIDHPETGLELLRRMALIRGLEQMIADRYPEEKMRCPTHLSIGQEAPAAAAGLALNRDDEMVSTHRSHAHYIGKGGDLNAMIAELYGKATGCAAGRGGSMHLMDLSVGYLASAAIVGHSIPVGVGAALSAQLQNTGRVCCVCLGDGAVEEGVFYESANFAVLRKLPVLFLCENNQYSVYTHLDERQPAGRRIWQLAESIGLRACAVDGYDAWTIYVRLKELLNEIRSGQGPALIEVPTYRWLEHCGPFCDDDLGYRPEGELADWKARDPMENFRQHLLELGLIDEPALDAMRRDIQQAAEAAFTAAEAAPFPDAGEAYTHLFQ
ncbi:MAG: thiamine pyrophosphate-dependent dehydrogenase E1 component subunit alpha [Verrucomicrobiota bacterium]